MNKHQYQRKKKQSERRIGCISNNNGWCTKVGEWCSLIKYCSKGVD